MGYGITATGFVKKPLEAIRDDLAAAAKARFGNINTDPDSIIGQIIDIVAQQMADAHELAEAIYNSQYPSSASGVSLDDVADIVGIHRLSALSSSVIASATGSQGTVIAAGKRVSAVETSDQFQSITDVTIDKASCIGLKVSVKTVTNSTVYTVTLNASNLTYTSDADATAAEIVAGLVAAINASSVPVTATDNGDDTFAIDADDIAVDFNGDVDARLQIDHVIAGLPLEAVEKGPIVALSGALTVIDTPVAGWDSVTNTVDATQGRDQETDAALRTRRAESLQIAGSGTLEAIRSQLRNNVAGVDDVLVTENRTGVLDGAGRPGHSMEVVVSGGANADIAEVIWEHKPAGIQMYGTESVVVVDSQGNNQTVYFSRATQVYLWVKITITEFTEETFPSGGIAAVAADALEIGGKHVIGLDVIYQKFYRAAFAIPGVQAATIELATSATSAGPPGAYSSANVTIDPNELAVFDSARIAVTKV